MSKSLESIALSCKNNTGTLEEVEEVFKAYKDGRVSDREIVSDWYRALITAKAHTYREGFNDGFDKGTKIIKG